MNKYFYTEEQRSFIVENFYLFSLLDLSKMFFLEFGIKKSPNTLGKYANHIGLKKNSPSKKHCFTKEQDEFICRNSQLKDYDLLFAINNFFHIELTIDQLRGRKSKLSLCKPIGFSNEEDLWIKQNYNSFNSKQLWENFCLTFREISHATLSKRTLFLGLRNKRHHYTKEQNEFLRSNVSLFTFPQLTEKFNNEFSTQVTMLSLQGQCLNYLCAKRGNNRFSASTLPMGTEVVKNGILRVKVSEIPYKRNERWVSKGRIVYEKNFGKTPLENKVIYLDGDRNNFSKDNLFSLSPKELGVIAGSRWFDKERNNLLAKIQYAKLRAVLISQ